MDNERNTPEPQPEPEANRDENQIENVPEHDAADDRAVSDEELDSVSGGMF